jgi:hypothetical protein
MRFGTYSGRRGGAARQARTAAREVLGFAATAARPWGMRRGLAAGKGDGERDARLASGVEAAGFREEEQQ